MKKLIIAALLIVAISPAFAQRKKIIKKTITITRDSVIYLPDTIAVYFKELIINNDDVHEKWNSGFIVWQTYNPSLFTSTHFSALNGTWVTGVDSISDYYKVEYDGDMVKEETFLYSDKTVVKNKVLSAIKR